MIKAVGKIITRRHDQEYLGNSQIKNLSNSILRKHPMNYLTISGSHRVDFIDPKDIVYMQSSGRYTEFILTNKKRKIIASKSLGEYEGLLNSTLFFRIHNTFMINLKHLININKRSGNYCEMSNGDALPISRRRYEGLMKYLKNG